MRRGIQHDVIIPRVAACSHVPHNTVSQKKLCRASYSVYTPGTKIKTETTSTFGERNRHTEIHTDTHKQREIERERWPTRWRVCDVINSRRVPWRWCPSQLLSPCICLSPPPTRLQRNKQLTSCRENARHCLSFAHAIVCTTRSSCLMNKVINAKMLEIISIKINELWSLTIAFAVNCITFYGEYKQT